MFVFALVAGAVLAATPPLSAAGVSLTGAVAEGTNSTGNYVQLYDWHTTALPSGAWYLWFIQGTDINGPFINGTGVPNSPAINIPLNLGDNTFTIYASHNLPDTSYYGLNLAFNGVNVPLISVFAPLQTSSTTVPTFSVNPSTSQIRWDDNPAYPSAGSDSFVSGAERVTLTDFRFAGVNVYNEDRVSPYSTVPDGRLDNVGQFTLNVSLVSAVPEPSSLTMLTMAVTSVLAGLGVARGRRIFMPRQGLCSSAAKQ